MRVGAGNRHDAAKLVYLPSRQCLAGAGRELPQHVGRDRDLAMPADRPDEHQSAPKLDLGRLLAEIASVHFPTLPLNTPEQRDSGAHSRSLSKALTDRVNPTGLGAPRSADRGGTALKARDAANRAFPLAFRPAFSNPAERGPVTRALCSGRQPPYTAARACFTPHGT